jgi:pSer/pThr/pTyr-binding forkhead associated (FHA) protein
MSDIMPSAGQGSIAVHLLDANVGGVVKSWKFTDRTKITIGRSDDRDVEVNDAYVSREHAVIVFEDQRWILKSLGRNGVVINNKPVTEFVLDTTVTFRLGSSGPVLRFSPDEPESANMRTLTFDEPLLFCQVDETKVHDDVTKIVESDYFQSLQDKARSMRRKQ